MELKTAEQQVRDGAEAIRLALELPDYWLNRRNRGFVEARVALCSFYYNERGFQKSEIGRGLNKDHATIIHALKNDSAWTNDRMYQDVKALVWNLLSTPELKPMSYSELYSEYVALKAELEALKSSEAPTEDS